MNAFFRPFRHDFLPLFPQGLLGVWSCRRPSRRLLTTFLTASGLAALAAGLLLTFSCAHLAEILW